MARRIFLGSQRHMTIFEGDFSPPAGRFAIVAGRFNSLVTEALLAGCLDTFARHGVDARPDRPGVGPGVVRDPARSPGSSPSRGEYAAVITLGCVIRGDTGHYDQVANQATSGIMQAGLSSGFPVIFGVLTTDTVEQALNRSGLKAGNKGIDAALAAIEMVNLLARIDGANS